MSTLFTIASGNLTDNIFARTITNTDITSQTNVLSIGTTPIDINNFNGDGSTIWGVSFNIQSRSQNATGKFSCKLYDSYNIELGSLVVPVSNFPAGDNSGGINGDISEIWQTLKFDNAVSTSNGSQYYLRLSASNNDELFFYGLPQLDETIVDFASNSDILVTGNVTQGSFNPYNTNTWSIYFNNGGYLLNDTNEAFNLSTNDFTIDFWCYLSEVRNHRIVSLANLNIDVLSSNFVSISGVTSNLSVPQNTWTHIAVTRTSNKINVYVDGIKSNDINIANNFNFSKNTLFLGRDRTVTSNYMHGYLYNFRITKKQALYTQNFTKPNNLTSKTTNGGANPSTLPIESNVEFLILCGENYLNGIRRKFVNSTLINAAPVSPFTTYTNCGYFRSSGAIYPQISLASPGLNSFTVETWFKTDSNNVSNFIILDCRGSVSDPGAVLYINNANDKISYQDNGSQRIIGSVIVPGVWYHCALVREAGQPIKLYLDGILQGSYGTAATTFSFGNRQYIGSSFLLNENLDGLSLKNFRITNTAVYTGDFTRPEADIPLSAISGTQLLLHFNNKNKQIFDRSGNNDLIIGGAPKIVSNTPPAYVVGKWEDDKVIYFNGVNDSISILNTNFNSSEFTLRCRFQIFSDMYFGRGAIVSKSFGSAVGSFRLEYDGRTAIAAASRGVTFRYSTNGTTWNSIFMIRNDDMGLWGGRSTHIYDMAFVSVDNTLKAYVNGVLLSSVNLASPIFSDSQPIYIGNDGNGHFYGHIDNVTLLNKAVYTSNFSITARDYYLKDAVFCIDGNVDASSLDSTHSQFKDESSYNRTIYSTFPGPISNKSSVATQRSLIDTKKYSYAFSPNYINHKNVYADYIEFENTNDFNPQTWLGFTIECWVKTNNKNLAKQPIFNIANSYFNLNLQNGIPVFGDLITSDTQLDNNWHHIAVVMNMFNVYLYVDGILKQTSFYQTYTGGTMRIGADFSTPINVFDGYISDLRITKNQALYVNDFTPPTSTLTVNGNGGALYGNTPTEYPLIENVLLLEADDKSTNPATDISYPNLLNGASITQAPSAEFSPFSPEEIYNKYSHGGSIYFDGTGDLITVSEKNDEYTFGSSDFTVEFWYYAVGDPTGDTPLLTWQGTDILADGIKFSFINSNEIRAELGNNNIADVTLNGTGSFTNQWNHIALTRSSNNYRLFINGKTARTLSYVGLNLFNDNNSIKLGENNCKGYMSDVRITKGECLYNEFFIPSSSALTLTDNGATGFGATLLTVSPNLLINGIKAGIYDASANNNILLEGNSFAVSLDDTVNASTNYKENTLIFNGRKNNNYLQLPASLSLDFSNDFWIDFWMKSSKFGHDTLSRRIVTLGSVSSVSALHVCINATGNDRKLQLFSNTNILSTNFDYADGIWHHVGIGRKGSTLSVYRDGVFDASAINSVNYNDGIVNGAFVGIYGDASRNKGRYDGKLTSIRIINGECVHTSNYALPSAAATLTQDGGTGVNNMGNVSLFLKLNNIVAPVNSHIITSAAEKLSSITEYSKTGNLTNFDALTSSRLPSRSAPGTTASLFIPGNRFLRAPLTNFQSKGDWTIETYVYPLTSAKENTVIFGLTERTILSINDLSLCYSDGAYKLRNSLLPNGINLSAAGSLSAWSHVAVCKKNNNLSMYVNGTRTTASTANIDVQMNPLSTTAMLIGALAVDDAFGAQAVFYGDIYNTRIIDGRALYDGNFNTTTVVVPSTLSATADTVFLYNNAKDTLYYKPGPIEKTVITGYLNGNEKTQLTVNNSLSDTLLNNISIQNGGVLTSPSNTNSNINITNNGLKIGAGGKFVLSAGFGYKKTVNLVESKIHVMHGGSLQVAGLQKTGYVTLTGSHAASSTVFTFNETPVNWLSGDSLLLLPTSAAAAQFDELTARSTVNNRLSTTSASVYIHQNYDGIPTVVNASRNISIKGLNSSRRGWIQFDKSSNSYICDTEFENLGMDGITTESLIFNVNQDGYALLSGCYIDGTGSTNVNGNNLFNKCYNLNLLNNTFYNHSGDALCINKSLYNSNISNNLLLRSGLNGLRFENISLNADVVMSNNIAIANGSRGTFIDNVDGYVKGIKNWLNTSQGLYFATPSKGENIDLTNNDTVVNDEATNNTVSFDTPFADSFPEETCTGSYTKSISWNKNSSYLFEDDFTIEGFFKFNAASTQESRLFVTNPGVEGIGSIKLTYVVNTRVLKFYTNESTNTAKITVTVPYAPLSMWHHIAVCREGGVISLYFNGERLGTYSSNFEFDGTVAGIAIGSSTLDSTSKSVYGFRVLRSAVYASQNNITIPSTPFTVDSDTVLLYKRTIKTGTTNINNIENYYNTAGGMFVDGSNTNLENTTISNISSVNNTTFGISISSTNNDYRESMSVTAKDLYIAGNKTIGFIVNNMTTILSGVYIANSTNNNAQFKLGSGFTKINGLTSLMGNNNPNIIIHSSKSYNPVIFNKVFLDKSTLLTNNYTGIPLYIRDTEFSNFNFDNSTISNVTTGYSISLSGYVLGSYQFTNTSITSAGVQNLSCLPVRNIKTAGVVFMNKNGVVGNHESYTRLGKRSTDTTLSAGNVAEKLTPYSATDKFKSGSKFVSINDGNDVTVKLNVAVSNDYNGNNPRLIIKKNSSIGIPQDHILYTIPKTTTYTAVTATTPVVQGNGIMEFYVDCDGTIGSIYVDDWKLINN
jgi:hypothetical protein